MKDYRELIVWQKAMVLVTVVYKQTATFRKEELYGLTSQIRRAAVSIPSNIAEGFGRRTTPDFISFLHIARGSLYELQTQLEIAKNLNYLSVEDFNVTIDTCKEIEKMLNSLIHTLSNKLK